MAADIGYRSLKVQLIDNEQALGIGRQSSGSAMLGPFLPSKITNLSEAINSFQSFWAAENSYIATV